jgi:hypothetical protein
MRLRWIALSLCASAGSAFSQSLPQSLRDCAAETDAGRRLSCYDREMERLNSSDTVPGAARPPEAAPNPPQEFGLGEERVRKLTKAPPVSTSLTAHIAAATSLPYGRLRLVLDNGQVWEQTEEDWGFAPQSGAAVTISRGALGGFWMATERYKKVRVKRIR